jgi:putative membrane protein
MEHFRLFCTSCMLAVTAAPAFAQQGPGLGMPGMGYGQEHMWGGGGGLHGGHLLVMLLALIGLVALIVSLVRWFTHSTYHGRGHGWCPHCKYGRGHEATEILEERFARGEIDKNEFEEKRKLLRR